MAMPRLLLRQARSSPVARQLRSAVRWPAGRRLESTLVHYAPSPTASREVPTPLILLSASKWSREASAEKALSPFVSHFTARGWSVSCLDLDPERKFSNDSKSEEILAVFEAELKTQMAKINSASPFPPLMMAQSLSTLIAENYVSSNPLSGLVLIDPPITPDLACEERHSPHGQFPTPLEPFTYEIAFPCLVVWSQDRAKELAFWQAHRIEHMQEEEAGGSLDRVVVDLKSDEEVPQAGPHQVRIWAEDYGMLKEELRSEDAIADEDASGNTDGEEKGDERKHGKKPIPQWYKDGHYTRNPKSKKMPLDLDMSHITESFIKGSGPGGQAINKTSSCVQLKHTPSGLVIKCQETRSRETNRVLCKRKMSQELERTLFGERDSVLGREARAAANKARVRRKKSRAKVLEYQELISLQKGKGGKEGVA